MFLYGLLAAAIPLALYLSCPSTRWNFDGVACAAAVELGNPVYWFHAQHLLYGFLGALSWKILSPLGFDRALPVLQLLSSGLSAGAATLLYRTLSQQKMEKSVALFLSAAAAASGVVWIWSIEAQVYALGYIGLAGATHALLRENSPRRGLETGVWHAIAMLGHLVHGLWFIPAIVFLSHERKQIRPYLASCFGTLVAVYAVVAVFVLLPYSGGPNWFANWIKGSLGLTPDRSIAWHWSGASGLWTWIVTTPQMWWGSISPYGGYRATLPTLMVTALSIGLFIFLLARALRSSENQRIIRFSLVWIATYAVFFWTWEPQTLCYRMTDVLPWTLLLGVGIVTLGSPVARQAVAGMWVLSLVVVTISTQAWPMRNSHLNEPYRKTMALVGETPASSVYLTAGGLTWIYLLYFSGRSAWNANTLSENQLNALPRPLYVDSTLLATPRIHAWASRRTQRPVAPEISWMEIL